MIQHWSKKHLKWLEKAHYEHADIILHYTTQESFFAHETGVFDYVPTEVKWSVDVNFYECLWNANIHVFIRLRYSLLLGIKHGK